MSAGDVDAVIKGEFASLRDDIECPLRLVLLESIGSCLTELDALDRAHPVWANPVVQTVNYSRLQHFVSWRLGLDSEDARAHWAIVAFDLKAGSCVSTTQWPTLERVSRHWRREWPVLQGFFNFYFFTPGPWLEHLKGYLVAHDLLDWALLYLHAPETASTPCVRWLTSDPEAPPQAEDLHHFADVLVDVAGRGPA
jgi:hypothetical protein